MFAHSHFQNQGLQSPSSQGVRTSPGGYSVLGDLQVRRTLQEFQSPTESSFAFDLFEFAVNNTDRTYELGLGLMCGVFLLRMKTARLMKQPSLKANDKVKSGGTLIKSARDTDKVNYYNTINLSLSLSNCTHTSSPLIRSNFLCLQCNIDLFDHINSMYIRSSCTCIQRRSNLVFC